MKLILLGAPGAGKGTQARLVEEKYHITHISTGDILREAIKGNTVLGIKAKTFINDGVLVPDEIVIQIIKERIIHDDCINGYILDGFPRTINQALMLSETLNKSGDRIDGVISIDVNSDEVIKRIVGRRLCKECGEGYHTEFHRPIKDGICNRCGGQLHQRDDDKEETIKKRLEVYKQQTEPLEEYYKDLNLLIPIEGMGEVKDIFERIDSNISQLNQDK